MRQNAETGGLHQFPSSLLNKVFFCSISLKRETQEARLLSGVVNFRRTLLHTLAGQDPENSERGGRDNCLLDTFYFAGNSIKNNSIFQRKSGDRGPLGHP